MPEVCSQHESINLRVHDLEGSDGRQWSMIKELGDALEVVQQTGTELNRKLELQNKELEHHVADRIAHRIQAPPAEKRNGRAQPDDTWDHLKAAFWKIVELALVSGALWIAMQAFQSVGK